MLKPRENISGRQRHALLIAWNQLQKDAAAFRASGQILRARAVAKAMRILIGEFADRPEKYVRYKQRMRFLRQREAARERTA